MSADSTLIVMAALNVVLALANLICCILRCLKE